MYVCYSVSGLPALVCYETSAKQCAALYTAVSVW